MSEAASDKKLLKKANSFRGRGHNHETDLPGTPTAPTEDKKHNDMVEKFQYSLILQLIIFSYMVCWMFVGI